MNKILIFGNSGTGKTTLARTIVSKSDVPYLDLDTITWHSPGVREKQNITFEKLDSFLGSNSQWVIEGCYGSLIKYLADKCTEMIFLNPGVESSLINNANREWEPHKYDSLEIQNEQFEMLQAWVKEYTNRDDEFSYHFHRKIFDEFDGDKSKFTSLSDY